MPSCILKSCKNNIKKSNKTHGITYHQFPVTGVRRQEWISIVRRERHQENWIPTKHTRICSVHFKSEDKYVASSARVYISKTAVPVIDNDLLEDTQNINQFINTNCHASEDVKTEENSTITPWEHSSKMELLGRIQQLLIQKMILTEKCKNWRQKCLRLQKRLNIINQEINNGHDTTKIRRSTLKWIESEVLGI